MRRAPAIAAASVLLMSLGAWRAGLARRPADLPDAAPLRALTQWDGEWYVAIARDGYWYHPGEQSPVAFFPLYPLAIRAASLALNRWVAAAALSLVFGIAALALFRRWARTVSDQSTAERATWWLALYPFALYLYGVAYSDALFLLLAIAAFYALERDRPWLAALFGALATAARPVAPAIVVGLVLRSLERRRARGERWRAIDFAPALAAAGLVAYVAYLGVRFDEPFAFAKVMAAPGWDQAPGWRTWLKVPWFETMFPRVDPMVAIRLGGHALATLVALAMIWPTVRRLGWGYGAYVALAVGIPAVSSKDFQGLGRYVIAAFPLFLTAATLVERRPLFERAALVVSSVVLALLCLAFGAGGYVA